METKERASWRAIRIAVAIPLALASVAALFPYTVIPVSSQAVVNARLTLVKAPLEGNLQGVAFETGDVVQWHQPLVKIQALPSTVSATNQEYERSLRDMQQKRAELDGRLKASSQRLSRASQETQNFAQHQVEDLKAKLQQTETEVDSSKAKLTPLEKELKAYLQAEKDHLMPHFMVQRANDELEKAQTKATDEQARAAELQRQVLQVQSGYFGGLSQAPSSVEKQDQASSDADLLRQELTAIDEQIRMATQKHAVGELAFSGTAVVSSPVGGVVWARAVAPGQSVGAGDDLFRIADAASIHVEVWLDRRYGPQLSIGDQALIYLPGLGKTVTGRVVSFQGTNRRRMDEEVNAIDLQPVHPDQYHVTIELNSAERKSIYIGQAAKVLFPGRPDAFVSKLYSWLVRL